MCHPPLSARKPGGIRAGGGRAGRDGLPSECLLLFSAGDVTKQIRFIEEKPEREQRIARTQLRDMIGYAEMRECRRAALLKYFGENWPNRSCDGCDNCVEPRETFDGTVPAQKFLSCVHRVRQKSGFNFGINHIVEVLIGAETDAIRQRGHDQVSTYGIGCDMKRKTWQAIGRELTRLGLIAVAPGKFATIELTPAGREVLKCRTSITLTKPADTFDKNKRKLAGEIECDEVLFGRLRGLRRKLANERDVPAYIIFSDASLREMARTQPLRLAEFANIPGVGQQKLKSFGEIFLSEIADHVPVRRAEAVRAGLLRDFRTCLVRPRRDSQGRGLRRWWPRLAGRRAAIPCASDRLHSLSLWLEMGRPRSGSPIPLHRRTWGCTARPRRLGKGAWS